MPFVQPVLQSTPLLIYAGGAISDPDKDPIRVDVLLAVIRVPVAVESFLKCFTMESLLRRAPEKHLHVG